MLTFADADNAVGPSRPSPRSQPPAHSARLDARLRAEAGRHNVQGFVGSASLDGVKTPSGAAQLVEPRAIDEKAELERALGHHTRRESERLHEPHACGKVG